VEKFAKVAANFGCLISLLGPLLALLMYPRAKWLFAFVLIGLVVLVLNRRLVKDPAPEALANEIEHLVNGTYSGWDVDNFEHRGIRDPQLKELWRRSMTVGGLPEEWVKLDEERKDQLRLIIRELRELGEARSTTDV
jgi:hypothetical protein